jgi:crotonobetainyl-CoA:carnitine CoA-transferase CaiB-like acyl-CoA transferase
MTNPMAALDGIRILDLTWGPGASVGITMLAEHGAEVIKVEPPTGDPFREYHGSAVWHRSRKSIALDLAAEVDAATMWELIATADVLVEGFRPGAMADLGFSYEAVRARHPALVYCSISAWPLGHRNEQRPGWDALVQAAGGAQFEQPGWRPGPVYNHAPTPTLGTMFLAPMGVLSALHQRSQTGRGQHVRTSLLQGLFLYTTQIWQEVEHWEPAFHELMAKTDPPGIHQGMIFPTADGYLHVSSLSGLTPIRSIEDILGIDQPHPYEQLSASPEQRAIWNAERLAAFASWKVADLAQALRENNHACEPIISAEQALAEPHPQLAANDMVAEVLDPELGATTQMGVPLHLLGTPGAIVSPRPRLDEHGAQLRAELRAGAVKAGRAFAAAADGPANPTALGGLTLVDFGQYLAGPFAPMLLGDLGMNVIKIEPVFGDNMRSAQAPFNGCARGKRSLALNVKDPRGKEIALEFVRRADVVHHNMTKGVATRLGIAYPDCRQINPAVIYCNTYAYGLNGPLSQSGGLDPLFQASGGIEYEQGAVHLGQRPLYVRFGFTDQANALLSAVGVLLALAHRDRTGEGQELWTSLLDGGATFASDALLVDGVPLERPHLDAGQHGVGPGYRLYQGQDGQYLQVCATTEAQWSSLCEAVGLAELSGRRGDPREVLEAALAGAFARRTVWSWKVTLDYAGVPNELPFDTQNGIAPLHDADNVRLGLVANYEHPIYGKMRQFGHLIDFSETPGRIEAPAPLVGQHTRELLDGIGLSQSEIDSLVSAGVAYEPDENYRSKFRN